MLLFGLAPTFVFLICGFMLMQLATNISQAAYQAYIPDLIEDSQRGLASGVKNVLGVLGAAVGLLGAQGVLSLTGKVWPAMGVLAAIMVLVGWLTLRWVPAIPQESPKRNPSSIVHALNPRPMVADFARRLREHSKLRYSILAQFLFLLGTYPAQRFLLLFLRDRFGDDAGRIASSGVVLAILLAVAAAIAAGTLSDQIGRRQVLLVSVVVGSVGLGLIGFATTVPVAAIAGALIAIGLGAFQSVNWAQMNDDLPEGKSASSLGVANFATAGAGTAAGIFGPIVDLVNAVARQSTYQVLFGLAALVALASLWPLARIRYDD